ncbi:MAG TPA: PEP-CTERM sorting domain-containing protein [Bryobacteraceae bacterium]|nr:PEP-CTERM sorting domain-containing protein [Bryobacteraceae bacterium]
MQSNRTRRRTVAWALAVAVTCSLNGAFGSSFEISTNTTTGSGQTLGSGSGQTGKVDQGVSYTVTGGTVAITITGANATVDNQGTISQTGNGRIVRDNTGVSNLIVNNGSVTNSSALMQAADADVIQMNKANASVTLNNYGTMLSSNASAGGSQAVDFNAITTGANVINNFSTGLMKAIEADAVRPGVNGQVNNWGTILSITTTQSSSDGVDLQTNSGAVITNYQGGMIEGARHGITGGAVDASTPFTASITNSGTIQGDDGSGINIDGFNSLEVVTITNNATGVITGSGLSRDGDGVDVDGVVNLTNYGLIQSKQAATTADDPLANSEGITVGGGTIDNYGTIQGLKGSGTALGRGITLTGNDIAGQPAGTRDGIYADATVTNHAGGLIYGDTDSAIVVAGNPSGHTATINNDGTIRGGGTTAAIQGGVDTLIINDTGKIDGTSSGLAIDMGSGASQLTVTGGAAEIDGDIDGGTGDSTFTLDPGAGNAFKFVNSIVNFSLVDVASGLVTLSGVSSYKGTTKVTGDLDLDGGNRLTGAGALDLNGGLLETSSAAGTNSETFGCLALTGSSTIDLDGSVLSFGCLGNVGAGDTLTVDDYTWGSYAFRFAGDLTGNASFESLLAATTINGQAASSWFDGTYTDVSVLTPEPATFAMIGLGLAFAMWRRRRVCRS